MRLLAAGGTFAIPMAACDTRRRSTDVGTLAAQRGVVRTGWPVGRGRFSPDFPSMKDDKKCRLTCGNGDLE
jgi:hypothetical protein